jgi:lipopolysaccharide export system protein LptA
MPTDRAPRRCLAVLIAGLATVLWGDPLGAQGVTDAFNLSMDSDKPVKIEADELEVSDADKTAVFKGNVVVKQGPTTMRTTELKVHYTGEGTATQDASGQRVSRLEATGRVVVESQGQKATGDWAVFEMATQEVTLGGSVVLSQGKNVLRGTRLVVNLETGKSSLVSEAGGSGGRVQGLFIPGSMSQKQEKRQTPDEASDQTN